MLRKVIFLSMAVLLAAISLSTFFWFHAHREVDRVGKRVSMQLQGSVRSSDNMAVRRDTGESGAMLSESAYLARNQRDLTALPQKGMSLSQIRSALEMESNSGNARASCLLGKQLELCTTVLPKARSELRSVSEKLTGTTSGEASGLGGLETQRAQMEELVEAWNQVCRDYAGAEESTTALEYKLKAAMQGFTPMAVDFSHPIFDPTDPWSFAESIAAYRSFGEQLLASAAVAGSYDAMLRLGEEYSDRPLYVLPGGLQLRIAKVDRVRALQYIYAARELSKVRFLSAPKPSNPEALGKYERSRNSQINFENRWIERLQAQLTAEEVLRAHLEADNLARGWSAEVFAAPAFETRTKDWSFDDVCRQ